MSALLYLLSLSLSSAKAEAADIWQVNYKKSSLSFVAIQEGHEIQGRFEDFDAKIRFDKENLKESYFDATINLNTVNTDIKDRDDLLRSADFFNIELWPKAFFKTLEIKLLQDNQYRADATLSIRNIVRPISFDFNLEIKETNQTKILIMEGSATLDRFEFDMAHGDFTGTDTVGPKINVIVKIEATLKP